jgi:hypothetical protein
MFMNDESLSLESFAEVTPKFNTIHSEQFMELISNFLVSEKYINKELTKLNGTKLHDFILYESLMEIENSVEGGRTSYGLTELSKKFYNLVNSKEFQSIYIDLLLFLYKKLGIDFYFQKSPTIRAHFPNEASANSYPFWHTDRQVGHPPSEINLWMPITFNKECTFSIMSYQDSLSILKDVNFNYEELSNKAYDDKDFKQYCSNNSIAVDGENGVCDNSSFCLFNSLRVHSTIPPEKETRISMDARIIPVETFDWTTKYKGVGRMGAEWWPGGKFGYCEKSIKEILSETH